MNLATKYRPKTFDDVIEQDIVKNILQNQIKNKDLVQSYLFAGPSGDGKAQPLYSKILTKNGFIQMKDISVGDEIYTHTSNLAKVKDIYPQGLRDIYEIKFNDNTSIRVADNHLNYVKIDNESVNNEPWVVNTLDLIEYYNNTNDTICVDTPAIKFKYRYVSNPSISGKLCCMDNDILPKECLINDYRIR